MKTNGYLLRLTAEFFGRFTAYGEPHGDSHMCIFYYELSKREFVTRTWFAPLFFPSSFVITARYVLIDLIRKSTSHKYTEESWKNLGNLTRWRALDLSLYFWIIKIKESLEVFVVIILFFARTNIITQDKLPLFLLASYFGWVRLIMKEFEIDGLPLRQFLYWIVPLYFLMCSILFRSYSEKLSSLALLRKRL